ncbi:hypothetical protein GYB22_03890 [bacterium]|nr:hypothetical protein [bacterium]
MSEYNEDQWKFLFDDLLKQEVQPLEKIITLHTVVDVVFSAIDLDFNSKLYPEILQSPWLKGRSHKGVDEVSFSKVNSLVKLLESYNQEIEEACRPSIESLYKDKNADLKLTVKRIAIQIAELNLRGIEPSKVELFPIEISAYNKVKNTLPMFLVTSLIEQFTLKVLSRLYYHLEIVIKVLNDVTENLGESHYMQGGIVDLNNNKNNRLSAAEYGALLAYRKENVTKNNVYKFANHLGIKTTDKLLKGFKSFSNQDWVRKDTSTQKMSSKLNILKTIIPCLEDEAKEQADLDLQFLIQKYR